MILKSDSEETSVHLYRGSSSAPAGALDAVQSLKRLGIISWLQDLLVVGAIDLRLPSSNGHRYKQVQGKPHVD